MNHVNLLTTSSAFDEAFFALKETLVKNANDPKVDYLLGSCINNYDTHNANVCVSQIKRLVDVLWSYPIKNLSPRCFTVFETFFNLVIEKNDKRAFFEEPNVIRTILAKANICDAPPNERSSANMQKMVRLGRQERGYALIAALPQSAASEAINTYLDHAANILIGEKWSIITSIYNIPRGDIQGFEDFLFNLPDSALTKSVTNDESLQSLTLEIGDYE